MLSMAIAPVISANTTTRSPHTVSIKNSLTSSHVQNQDAGALRTVMLTTDSLKPMLAYFTQVIVAEKEQAAQTLATQTAQPTLPNQVITPSGSSDSTTVDTADWDCIRLHESGRRYNDPTAPSGAYGIEPATAAAYGLAWPVSSDSSASQDSVALQLYNRDGWQPWSTRFVCGL